MKMQEKIVKLHIPGKYQVIPNEQRSSNIGKMQITQMLFIF